MLNQLIIFSKNRACQLHLLLESIEKQAVHLFDSIAVIYKADPAFLPGYNKLIHYWNQQRQIPIYFHLEQNFHADLIALVNDRTPFTTFLVDDMVFIQPVDASQQDILSQITDDVFCFSLRLGKNCTYSHPANLSYKLGEYQQLNGFIKFNFNDQPRSDFAYPISSDGHIYKTHNIKWLLYQITCVNPNTMETNMQFWLSFLPPFLAAFDHSKTVSVPVNIVNTTHSNRTGMDYAYAVEHLNLRYLEGQIIDYGQLDFSDIRGPHQEIPFAFKPLT